MLARHIEKRELAPVGGESGQGHAERAEYVQPQALGARGEEERATANAPVLAEIIDLRLALDAAAASIGRAHPRDGVLRRGESRRRWRAKAARGREGRDVEGRHPAADEPRKRLGEARPRAGAHVSRRWCCAAPRTAPRLAVEATAPFA